MKNPLLLAAVSLIATAPLPATTFTWDTSVTAGIQDGAGVWNTSTANWTTDAGTTDIAYGNAANDAVIIGSGGVGGTITVDTVNANALTFGSTVTSGYTLSGGIITLSGVTPTITTNNTAFATTISSVLSGSAGLVKSGAGTLILSAENTYTGTTTINAGGALQVGAGGSTGMIASNTVINNGALLLNRADAGGLDFNSTISGSGTLNNIGSGFVWLRGDNSYTGATQLSSGILIITHANALGSTAAGTTVADGASLMLYADINIPAITTAAETLTLNGHGYVDNGTPVGALLNYSGANTYAGTVTLASASRITSDSDTLTLSNTVTNGGFTLTLDGSGATIITGALSGTGALNKIGAGTLTLSGANTGFSGATSVNAGTLAVGHANALGTGAVTVSGGTLQIGATNLTGIASLTVTAGTLNTTDGSITTTGAFTLDGGTWVIGNIIDAITAGSFTLTSGLIDLSGFTNKSTAGTYSLIDGTGTSAFSDANFTNGDTSFSYSIAGNGDLIVSVVPEPSTYGIIGAGALASLALVRRRNSRRRAAF